MAEITTTHRIRLTLDDGTEKTYCVTGPFTKHQALEHFEWLQSKPKYTLVGRDLPLQKGYHMPHGSAKVEGLEVDGPPKKPMPMPAVV